MYPNRRQPTGCRRFFIRMYVRMYAYAYAYAHTHMCTHAHVRTRMRTPIRTYAHAYIIQPNPSHAFTREIEKARNKRNFWAQNQNRNDQN